MKFTLPLQPTLNHYYTTCPRTGRKILSKEGRAYRQAVEWEIWDRRRTGRLPKEPLTGRVHITLTFRYKDRRRYDISNFVKALEDALTHAGVYQDDGQIDEIHLIRGAVSPGNGHVIVEVDAIEIPPDS